jgi:hypothetical protein
LGSFVSCGVDMACGEQDVTASIINMATASKIFLIILCLLDSI